MERQEKYKSRYLLDAGVGATERWERHEFSMLSLQILNSLILGLL